MSSLPADPALAEKFCLVLDGEGWHRGVIGIVASRVVEKTGRPALVVARDGEEAHGSGRSITALHLLDALESCREVFTRFGGHSHAVGFAMPSARVEELKQQLDAFARTRLTVEDFQPQVRIDSEIALSEVTPDLLNALRQLEPFGHGNREPVFSSREVDLLQPPRIIKDKHIKLRVSQKQPGRNSFTYEAMGWRMAERVSGGTYVPGDKLDLAFTITMNEHPEYGGLELALQDFQKSVLAVSGTNG